MSLSSHFSFVWSFVIDFIATRRKTHHESIYKYRMDIYGGSWQPFFAIHLRSWSWTFLFSWEPKGPDPPQIIHFNRVFHYKPSILGYPYFLETPKCTSSWNWCTLPAIVFLPTSWSWPPDRCSTCMPHVWPPKQKVKPNQTKQTTKWATKTKNNPAGKRNPSNTGWFMTGSWNFMVYEKIPHISLGSIYQ